MRGLRFGSLLPSRRRRSVVTGGSRGQFRSLFFSLLLDLFFNTLFDLFRLLFFPYFGLFLIFRFTRNGRTAVRPEG